jgi:broad specificity phosphatase PhoE
MIKEEPIYAYTSPYLRTRQTLANVISALSEEQVVGVREEPRLTEQQFGNFQDVSEVRHAKNTRAKYGRFYFRFPLGESGLDVYNRASSFINTLQRDFYDPDVVPCPDNSNMLLMTHGLTMRLLMMRFFQYTVTDFENSENSRNCGIVIMERRPDFVAPERHSEAMLKLPQVYSLNEESRNLVNFPKEGKEDFHDLVLQMSRPGLSSMVDPGDHMKYWSTNRRGKKTDFK